MLKHSEFNAEHKKGLNLSELIMRPFLLKAFAEEQDPPQDPPKDNTINYEQLIASARKEEKEKLYPRLKKLEDENKTLTTSVNGYLLKIAEVQKELDEAKSSKGDNEEITKLQGQITTLEAENKTLKESTPNAEAIRAQIEKEYEVKLYRTEQLNEHKEEILSVFENDIVGATKEEIDKSIEAVKTKTIEIKKALGLDTEGKKDDKKKDDKKDPKSEKQKKAPVANPAVDDDDKFDADYVRNLDPHSKEYAEWRKKMGLK